MPPIKRPVSGLDRTPPLLADRLKAAAKRPKRPAGPVWKGPEEDGVTFSLLSRFLACRERFRVLVVEGLRPKEGFEPRIEFGQMWHAMEEAGDGWYDALTKYARMLMNRYPFEREAIDHWRTIAGALYPVYQDYWAATPDPRTPLLREQVFDVPYVLPSGRAVRLRGKIDDVSLQGKGRAAGVYVGDHKTKSSIDQPKISRQLTFDLQTMIYLIAGRYEYDRRGFAGKGPLAGIWYNVVRRPAHKSAESMLKKVTEDCGAGRGVEWFARWRVEVPPAAVARFRRECLDPILEQLYEWWECQKFNPSSGPFSTQYNCNYNHGLHYRHPFGVYNPMDEGGCSELDEYLISGSEVGLERTDDLFRELKT